MKPRHQISRAAIDLIKRFEGYRKKSARLPDGRWTIGYGHTLTAREGVEVTEQDAEALLMYDLIAVAHSVNEWTFTPLTQNQFDALCAFAFNIGVDNFRRSSVLRRVNEGQLLQAACAMELWRKADFEGERIVIDALVRRRSAEKTLFLTPAHGWVPAPSPILRPNVDMDATGLVPRETPTVVKAPMDGPEAVVVRDTGAAPILPVVPEEEGPSPTQTAAAVVTSRLSTIFREPETPKAEPQPEPEAAAEPVPVMEPEPAPAPQAASVFAPAPAPSPEPETTRSIAPPMLVEVTPAPEPARPAFAPADPPPPPPAPIAMAAGDRAFVLTPPEPEEPAAEPALRLDLPTPANEAGPTLFDPRPAVANDELAQPEPPPAPARRIIIDDTLEFDPDFDSIPPEQPKLSLLPLIALAVTGLAFFAGGLFWAASVPPDVESGLFNPMTVGWMAGIAGIGFFGVAAYLMLGRLGHVEADDGDEEFAG
ncbi:MAG TPA: glycoside hydrolase family protein [Phenylobacterium sp.]|nr:glycoside hydrolase family protein [Phenylobacterium sp.]